MSNDIIVNGGLLHQGTNPKSKSSSNTNLIAKIKPKLAKRYLSFQKTKPSIDYFSLIKTIRNPNELISTTEVILSQRQYYPSLTYNTEIQQYPPIKKHHKLYKTHRVKNLTIEDPSKPINTNQNKAKGNDNDINAPLYIETFLMNRNPQCKIGNTIYTELTKRKNAYLDKLMQGNDMLPNQQPDYITQEAKKRIHCLKVNHPNTNYHDMKKIDSIPVVNTYGCNSNNCNEESLYGSVSEKERYRKSTANLIRLRELINNNPDLCNAFLKEYLWRHGIYEDEYYRISKLVNLSNYLNSDFKINPKKSMKEILIEGLNYLDEEHHGTCNSDIQSTMHNDNKAMTQQYFTNLKQMNTTNKKRKKAIMIDSKDEVPQISNIITDMSLQNHLYNRSAQRTAFDIINQPDQIVKLYQSEFSDDMPNNKQLSNETIDVPIPNSKLGLSMKKREKAYRPKTLSTNERLFEKKRPKTDYEFVKKNNKLLEYVCYMKAKDNLKYLHLRDKLFYNKGSIEKKGIV